MLVDKVLILNELMRYKNFASKADFARFLEITPQSLAKWFERATFDINIIVNKFPEVNQIWLLTGTGIMLKAGSLEGNTSANQKGATIRYWPELEATGGGVMAFDDGRNTGYTEMVVPNFKDCTDALPLVGDSMYPIYKAGDVIIIKKWNERYVDFGQVYLIITSSGNRMVKYIFPAKDDQHILCKSENKDNYPPFEIEKEDILALYLVKGKIVQNAY